MANILKKITLAAKNRTTYRVGLLQASAFRVLNKETVKVLEPYGITNIEWAFLGLLFDYTSLRPKQAADELGVEAPFITTTFQKLEGKDLVEESPDPLDSRAKIICLTQKGKDFVRNTEPLVLAKMRKIVEGIPKGEMLSYIAVLEKIVVNSKNLE